MSDDLVKRIARIIEAEEGAYLRRGPLWAEVAARKAMVVAGEPYAARIAALEAEVADGERFRRELCDQISELNDKVADYLGRAEKAEAEVARLREALEGE